MKWIKLLLSAAASVALCYILNFRQGQVPPLGKFLNPFAGFWLNNERMDDLPSELRLPGLDEIVHVVWDDRRIPHIFARNDHDLYFAQGYVTAHERLWQMEFATHGSAGRLAEIIGPAALEYDRFRRRIGMVYGAENGLKAILADSLVLTNAEAYAAGVNAWTQHLAYKDLPLEYKILDYHPEEWTVFKNVLLLKYFAWTLSFRSNDAAMTRARTHLGDKAIDELFPILPPFVDPVVPPGTTWDFKPIRLREPATKQSSSNPFGQRAVESAPSAAATQDEQQFVGSNNWAVSGKLTASGNPILCSDPHLGLTLPSIWIEMQLVAPGVNVYGITSPGAPGIIFGFNDSIAWGLTNAGSDALDWYELKFKDESKREYWHAGQWRSTTRRVESINVRGADSVVDTIIYTHHGPVVYPENEKPFDSQVPVGTAMRWTALDESNESIALYKLNRARNYYEYRQALASFDGPGQNFAFASVGGDIAIVHNGKYPLRQNHQGRTISDGSDPSDDWQGWVPHSQLPFAKNPSRGFVSSANQTPADPSYPYYLGYSYAPHERGARINDLLKQKKQITPEEMLAMQNDLLNLHAKKLLPTLLSLVRSHPLSEDEKTCLRELEEWNLENRATLIAPRVYESWWGELYGMIWMDETDSGRVAQPGRDVTTHLLLNNPASPYIDDKRTERVETFTDLALASFQAACSSLQKRLGPFGPAWAWGKSRSTNIQHLARMPGLGRMKLETNGNHNTINAITTGAGPSWRMVVELGSSIKAWTVYPGGQSGNPGSPHYDDFLTNWLEGKAYEVLFLHSADGQHERIAARTLMRGGE
ncbi:MAG TPA: penicillin acylase family protein [Bacteroidetes bacterium]|nr:penicillin acylase family protein [Bacteroidota bacterium]